MREFEVLQYELFGWHLQEPLSLLYNWLVCVLSWVWFKKLTPVTKSIANWRYFFLTFAITSFFAGLAHTFYQYIGIYGKFPHWIGGILSGFFAGKAMLLAWSEKSQILELLLRIKLVVNSVLAITFASFIFVIVDSALTYIIYCAGISYSLVKRGVKEYKLYIFAVITSFLGALSFLFKLDFSLYFNREDFSHLFILASLIMFYSATKRIHDQAVKKLEQ